MWVSDKIEGRNKIKNFKLRPESEAQEIQQQNILGSYHQQRNVNKSVGSQYTKNLPPFQFLSGSAAVASAGPPGLGWTLFQGENQPYIMNSNAVKEMLLSSQCQLQQQQRQTNIGSKDKEKTKKARRRLFSEDGSSATGNVKQQQERQNSRTSLPSTTSQTQQINKSIQLRNQILNSSAWTDFSFDRERLYKAFFTPPSM